LELILLVLLVMLAGVALVAALRVLRKLEELEERLQESAPLAFLPDRVQAVARSLEAADLGGLHERVERLAAGLARVEDLVAAPAENGPAASTRSQLVRARVIRSLREDGLTSVRVEASEADLEQDPAQVRVRALRRGTLVHGSVTVSGDEVVDVRLDPIYTAFP
jgi:hypothetical protein